MSFQSWKSPTLIGIKIMMNIEKLPKGFNLNWPSKDWDIDEVSKMGEFKI